MSRPMRCAYCGAMKVWPDDFPVRTEACCPDCLPKPEVSWWVRTKRAVRSLLFGRASDVSGRTGPAGSVPPGGTHQ